MKAFILSVSLTAILTTSAVAAAMRYLDEVQNTFAAKSIPAIYQRQDRQEQTFTVVFLDKK